MRKTILIVALLVSSPALAQELAPRRLTIDDALALAAKKNLDLRLQRSDVELAQTDVSRAFSGYLPRLDLDASTGRQWIGAIEQTDIRGSFISDPTQNDNFDTTLSLTQPIFSGFRTTNDVRSAKAAERAQRRLYDEAELTVAFDVTQSFYQLVKAERSLDVLVENAKRSQELVDRADALYAAGKMAKSDTIQARVNLGNDQIAIQNQRVVVQTSRSALATALGLPADEALDAVPPPSLDAEALPSYEPPPLDALLKTAKERRPLLDSDTAAVEAARAAVGSARADYFPTLAVQARYSRFADSFDAGKAFDDPARQYTANAGLVLSWNLFEGGLTRANVQRAQQQATRAQTNAERNEVLVAQQLADARASVLWLNQTVKLSAENLGVAQQGVALARERLAAGLMSQLEARDANLKLTQAQLALVQARINHAIAVADLNRAVGGAL